MRNIGIKKIDKLLLDGFIKNLLSLFVLVLFVLVIQQFFILLKDITGKGLSLYVYGKLLYYLALAMLPSVFPIAVLIACLLLFGNFSETGQLTAMRSFGLSLYRICRMPWMVVCCLSMGLFYFQHWVHPTIMPKVFALIFDVYQKKADLFLQPGIFCHNIPGYAIRVDKKIPSGGIEGVMIYDRTQKYSKLALTLAEKGHFYTTPNGDKLVMELFNGYNYIEPLVKGNREENDYAKGNFYRNRFSCQKLTINLKPMQMGNTFENRYANQPSAQNYQELQAKHQLLQENRALQTQKTDEWLKKQFALPANTENLPLPLGDSVKYALSEQERQAIVDRFMHFRKSVLEEKLSWRDRSVVRSALPKIKQKIDTIMRQVDQSSGLNNESRLISYEQAHRFSVALRCIVMLLLAAPLGAIIGKGGFGMAVANSSFFMLVEYLLSIWGREMVMMNRLPVYLGASLSEAILLPFCVLFWVIAQRGGVLALGGYLHLFKTKFRAICLKHPS